MMKKIIIILFIWIIYLTSPVVATINVTEQGGLFPVSVGLRIPSAIYVDDINEDGLGEIIVEGYIEGNQDLVFDSNLYLLNTSSGTLKTISPLTVHQSTNVMKMPDPVAGNIVGDNKLEIISGDKTSQNLYAWDSDGVRLPGFPINLAGNLFSTPALADIDNDGLLEIAIGCDGNQVYLIKGNGTILKQFAVGGAVHSQPIFGNFDDDTDLEIAVTSRDNKVYAFNQDGSNVSGWPQSITPFGVMFLYNSPAVGDIDNDGRDEIIVAATVDGNIYGGKVIAFDSDGSVLWTGATYYNAYSSPVIGNIDQDTDIEIIVVSVYKIFTFEHDGTPKWTAPIGETSMMGTPQLIDITGNGIDEIFFTTRNGIVHGMYSNGTFFMQENAYSQIDGAPSIYDFDDDGLPEVIVGTYGGKIHAWKLEYTPDDTDTPGTSIGGGGGGGGGGGSGEDYANIEGTENVLQFILMEEKISYNLKNSDPIIKVEFIALKNAGSINAVVEVLRNTSSMVTIPPPDIVYKNVNIYVGLYGFATEQNIKDAVIYFKVNKDWINLNDIGKSSIVLFRYIDGNWTEQPTNLISEDGDFVYYEASVTGLDNFAISGEKEDKKIFPDIGGLGTKINNLIQSGPDIDITESGQTSGINNKYIFIGLLGICLIIISIIIYRKKSKQ